MQRKLTLRMDAAVVRHAKRVAKERKTSVSNIVEEHLKSQPNPAKKKSMTTEIPEWNQELGGGKKPKKIKGDPRYDYLLKKYCDGKSIS